MVIINKVWLRVWHPPDDHLTVETGERISVESVQITNEDGRLLLKIPEVY
jgi:hypothetical protein